MPRFTVTIRQDAWIPWEITLDASSAAAAHDAALDIWDDPLEDGSRFIEGDPLTYDHIECDPEDDVEEIEDDGPAAQA